MHGNRKLNSLFSLDRRSVRLQGVMAADFISKDRSDVALFLAENEICEEICEKFEGIKRSIITSRAQSVKSHNIHNFHCDTLALAV